MATSVRAKKNSATIDVKGSGRPAGPTPSGEREGTKRRARDNERPLVEDIRLLGRILGDVLRHQEGNSVFEVVETIRQTAVRFRREADPQAGSDLNKLLKKLTRDQTISVVRAFS